MSRVDKFLEMIFTVQSLVRNQAMTVALISFKMSLQIEE